MDNSELKEVGVTQRQYNETWNMMPPKMRSNAPDCPKAEEGFVVMPIGNLRVWVDQYLPEDYVNEEVRAIAEGWDPNLAAQGMIDEQRYWEKQEKPSL